MRTLLFGFLTLVAVSMAVPQTLNPRETITVGIDLSIGMSEDAAIKKLTESGYRVRKREPPNPFKEKGITSAWFVDEGEDGNTRSFGVILFSSGRLATAMKELLPDGGNQVEFGRQLYFAMRDLEMEGDSHCTIKTDTQETPEFSQKAARLQCGKKTIVIDLQKFQNKNEVVSLNEELSR